MRAIKYLEYREYAAAQLLYRCSSPMELNLTVVSAQQHEERNERREEEKKTFRDQ